MKNNKAAGVDGIPVEFFKVLTLFCIGELAVFNRAELVKGWKVARIFPMYKANNEKDIRNYRRIALLNIRYKILTSMLAVTLKNWFEENRKLKESQAGFRENRSTGDHIFTLNTVMNYKLRNKEERINVRFIDFKTAFDRVNREILIEKMRGNRD
ncbi:uncharacterized protein LOC106637680 [Copidosoma floridanum]|uniref:uncharacterized protein LOC106637680 n=1 Tax=Copidosoma floridanum TaxID=29053 RepID=UPI0006C95DC3|nr:uncharacterized protein LOC106637680 [Copidosoma floridanum]